MNKTVSFSIDNFLEFKIKMLDWANQFGIFCFLDNNQYKFQKTAFECLLGVGCKANIKTQAGNAFESLKQFSKQHNDWLFGHFSYDLKNEIEKLSSSNFDGIEFPDLHFFVPSIVVEVNDSTATIQAEENHLNIFNEISAFKSNKHSFKDKLSIKPKITKDEYIKNVEAIRQHILKGDCYELNFCQEFFSKNATISPIEVYKKLSEISPAPLAVLYKLDDNYCICSSPERYLKKERNSVISQPIKGTAKRNLNDALEDERNKNQLKRNKKEQSENVMVVDLVRNDLSKVCSKGSVAVKELFGIYSYPQVHQMISTVEGKVDDTINWTDIIKATFPMGSMTGVPKKRVMELIEEYELTKRGIFSGAIGYVKPNKDFDFNVVIRSIMYNEAKKYLCYQVGSAITFESNATNEYEECLLKANAIKTILS